MEAGMEILQSKQRNGTLVSLEQHAGRWAVRVGSKVDRWFDHFKDAESYYWNLG